MDGRIDVLGSDEQGILRAASVASTEPHGVIRLERHVRDVQLVQKPSANVPIVQLVHIAAQGLPPHGPAQVLLAVVEDGLVSKVLHGENEGGTLPHTAVVRALKGVGSIAASAQAWEGDVEIPSDPAWKRTRIAVFIQDRESLRVLAAGSM